MKELKNWLFPGIALVVFGSLLAALLLEMESVSLEMMMGVLAYSLAMTVMFISIRPKLVEPSHGLPSLYAVHGALAIVLTLSAIIHQLMYFDDFQGLAEFSLTSWAGFFGVLGFTVATLTGMFGLSSTFISKSRRLLRLKNQVFNREINLWLHRLAVIGSLGAYLHLLSFGFLRSNTLFISLASLYALIGIGGYFVYKLSLLKLPRYEITAIKRPTPTLFSLEFTPKNGQLMTYEPGQYVFVRLKNSSLPAESHPFSISSAPNDGANKLEVMIKKSGDFTNRLDELRVGDVATLEGPYGHFLDKDTKHSQVAMVLLAGGIGATPILSILRQQMKEASNRPIDLVWALAYKEDLMLLDELEAMKVKNPNFNYHFIFSDEEVAGYPFGFVTGEYLATIGLEEAYSQSRFFICGPPPMMNAVKGVLAKNGVVDERIYIEEFGF
ncbi:ferredoxin reductase family protein [Fundicoccus sp. Sow4_D5]|uniref:ferredoxin reductase family protein n=1 Tax=Fundicoccus sp. Sow4_D5 TaxID=3438782 RepID=UPI003F90AE52